MEILKNIILKGKIYIPRKWIDVSAYYILPAVLIVLHAVPEWRPEYHELGEIAYNLLLFILFVKPVSILFPQIGLLRTIVGYRRQLGIPMSYFAFFHFLGYTLTQPAGTIDIFFKALQSNTALLWGALALIVTVVLYVTSNKFSQKHMKKWWKRLQRLAYLLLFLVLIHVAVMEQEPMTGVLILCGYAILKSMEWMFVQQRKRMRNAE